MNEKEYLSSDVYYLWMTRRIATVFKVVPLFRAVCCKSITLLAVSISAGFDCMAASSTGGTKWIRRWWYRVGWLSGSRQHWSKMYGEYSREWWSELTKDRRSMNGIGMIVYILKDGISKSIEYDLHYFTDGIFDLIPCMAINSARVLLKWFKIRNFRRLFVLVYSDTGAWCFAHISFKMFPKKTGLLLTRPSAPEHLQRDVTPVVHDLSMKDILWDYILSGGLENERCTVTMLLEEKYRSGWRKRRRGNRWCGVLLGVHFVILYAEVYPVDD